MTTMTAKESETYQGWKNHVTWAVALHINNEQATQGHAHALRDNARHSAPRSQQCEDGIWTAEEAVRYTFAESLKDWIEDVVVEEYPDGSSFADLLRPDLLRGYLSDVDWDEIALSFLESQ